MNRSEIIKRRIVKGASIGFAFVVFFAGSNQTTPTRAKVAGVVITTTTTTAPTTTTTLPKTNKPAGLGLGAKGEAVTKIQQRLIALHYDVPAATGTFDQATYHSVMAFQKANKMTRNGRATDDVIAALNAATNPAPLIPDGGATRIEVDVPRQVLLYYKGNKLNRIVSISTGNGKKYCVEGQCEYAVTPGGRFRITRRIKGEHESKLGTLWNPVYFNRGIAIHGSASVPGYPASHGCVRVPLYTSEWIYRDIPNGTPVYVIGGPTNVPPPFAENPELLPGQQPPAEETTTTTTVPTTVPSTTSSSSTTSTTSATTTSSTI